MAPGICRTLARLLAFTRMPCIHTVVCSIFVPADQLLSTEKITVGASANFMDGLALYSAQRPFDNFVVRHVPMGQDRRRWNGEHICRWMFQ